jgi:hypothetical protein
MTSLEYKRKYSVDLGFPRTMEDYEAVQEFCNRQFGYDFHYHRYTVPTNGHWGMTIYFHTENDLSYFMLCCGDRFKPEPSQIRDR